MRWSHPAAASATPSATLTALLTAVVVAIVGVGGPTPASAEPAMHRHGLDLDRASRVVAVGSDAEVITARPGTSATGRVTFTLKSADLRLVHRIRLSHGRVVYRPRRLGTGHYRVVVR